MHTYYSALPFTPHDTRLYSLYEQETHQSITVLQGLSPTWTSCLSSFSLSSKGQWKILGVSPDGMLLAVGLERKIMILDARTTASQCQISLTNKIACLAFSPSEGTLATVTAESLELWNTTTGINQKTQTLSGTDFYAVSFSPQGQYLLLSIDQGLHLHHGMDASELSVLSTDWSHEKIIFASNDKQAITGSAEGYIHFFTLSGNQLSEIQERRIFNETAISGLVLRHDGTRLASGGRDGTIRIYDLPTRSHITTLQLPESGGAILSIAYHPMEEELAVGQGTSVVLWREKETPHDWTPSIHSNHRWVITAIFYCQNGTRMYANMDNGEVKLLTTTVTQVQEPPKHAYDVIRYAVHQPTSRLATGSLDRSIILWNFTTGDYQKTLRGHTGFMDSIVFSDDGVFLASGGYDRTTIVWHVASGISLHKLGPHDSCNDVFAFSEDNAHLTTKTAKECFVWELTFGTLSERRDRDMSVDKVYTTPYYLENVNGWQTVVESSQRKKCKYGLCRPPGEYRIVQFLTSPIFGDRAALFCSDGRVLFLDISRVMHVYMMD